jgi:hypothetical protein
MKEFFFFASVSPRHRCQGQACILLVKGFRSRSKSSLSFPRLSMKLILHIQHSSSSLLSYKHKPCNATLAYPQIKRAENLAQIVDVFGKTSKVGRIIAIL